MAYLAQFDRKSDPILSPESARQPALIALEAAARGEVPTRSPRGGTRRTPRYFVRRAAWHLLDHA